MEPTISYGPVDRGSKPFPDRVRVPFTNWSSVLLFLFLGWGLLLRYRAA